MIKLGWMNKKRFTGLEIEPGFVKLAQAQDFAGIRKITKLIVKKLASSSEKDIVETLKNIAVGLKGQLGQISICIPRHKATVRFLKFPSVNEKEIAGMVRLQSAKELPFAKEEIISDYIITERTRDGYAKVVLAIVHQDVINSYLNILKKANLEPERITFSTEAVLDWYRTASKQKSVKAGLILIDLDANNTDIAILDNSCLRFTRGLAWGGEQLQRQPDLKHKLADEIRRTIEGYARQEEAKKIEKILLNRPAGTIEGLQAFLEQEFNIPCQIFSPLENLSCRKELSLAQYSPEASLLRILGMVLSEGQTKLNLLPLDLREKQKLNLRRKRLYTTLGFLIGIVLLGSVTFVKKTHDKQLYIFYLDEEIKKNAPKAKEVEDMLKKIELIEARREISGSSVDVLRELHNLVPQNISLAGFSYDEENKTISVQGACADMSEIFKLVNSLEKSPIFKNAQLKYVSEKKTKAGGGGLTDFKIECSLEK